MAIVGPNGSGKSNVADAVRWVLGEQSPKLLRLNRSEEIIFAGTSRKPKASMAEVSLLLSNDTGKIPIDAAEVEIIRRLYRNGDSEYLVNGQKVRLSDLQELLAKAGFGQNSYAVIGQGMVDKLLLASPVERKTLFEEASGTRQYEIRRNQHLRKLEQTVSNITELDALIAELTPRCKSLAADARALDRRIELESELALLRRHYQWQELDSANNRVLALTKELERLSGTRVAVQRELSEAQEERSQQQALFKQAEEARRSAAVRYKQLSEERTMLLEQLAVLQTQATASSIGPEASLKQDSLRLRRELAKLTKAKGVTEEKMARVKASVDTYDHKIAVIETTLKTLNEALTLNKREIQKGQRREYLNHALGLLNLLAHKDNIATMDRADRELALHKMRRMLRLAIEDRSDVLAQEISGLQSKVTRQMGRREDIVEERNKEVIKLRGLELDLAAIEEATAALSSQLEALQAESNQLTQTMSRQAGVGQDAAALNKRVLELEKEIADTQKLLTATSTQGLGGSSSLKSQMRIERLVAKHAELALREKELTQELKRTAAHYERQQSAYLAAYGSSAKPVGRDVEVRERDISRLEAELGLVAKIDPAVAAESKELADRLLEVTTQRADLVNASEDLSKLIKGLDADIQKHFEAGFRAINAEFGSFFAKLFGGGKAELTYEIREDGKYGIEITVTPPGKRSQQLAVLSGGERALGGIALLAAIMAVNPSPFIVLDEVDAALDDANARKFNQILTELKAKTQLIVITHNHGTMQSAQQLIGITSDAQGAAMAVSAQLTHHTDK